MYKLNFEKLLAYNTGKVGIELDVTLKLKDNTFAKKIFENLKRANEMKRVF